MPEPVRGRAPRPLQDRGRALSGSRGAVSPRKRAAEPLEQLRGKINTIELNRDDKAHRFVVTINAFNDGNRLAYLALGIAIAIDSLIFMSGLFGANAVRSPLSDVPSVKARSAQQLEAIIENALLPDTYEKRALRCTPCAPSPTRKASWRRCALRASTRTPQIACSRCSMRATIHAVAYEEDHDRYLVRAELFEFLSLVAKRAFETSSST